MKKLKKLVIATGLMLSMSVGLLTTQSEAATNYQAKSGDTYWKIANRFGVSLTDLKNTNHKTSNLLYIGENLIIPDPTMSIADKELIAKLVHAEAKGEPYAGKVAVATVVLNRVASSRFPNNVRSVIYQKANGYYAFTPVQNGAINEAPDAASRAAVNEALAYRGEGKGSLFFYNPKTAVSKWIFSREVTVTIGNHRFAK